MIASLVANRESVMKSSRPRQRASVGPLLLIGQDQGWIGALPGLVEAVRAAIPVELAQELVRAGGNWQAQPPPELLRKGRTTVGDAERAQAIGAELLHGDALLEFEQRDAAVAARITAREQRG